MLCVIGDSHGFALDAGRALLLPEDQQALVRAFGEVRCGVLMWGFHALEPFFTEDAAGLRFLGEAGDKFASVTASENLIVPDDSRLFGLSLGFHTAVMARNETWQTHSMFARDDRQFLSQAVLRACVLHETRHILAFADALTRLRVRCFMLTPPPVRRLFAERYSHHMSLGEVVGFQQRYWAIMQEAFAVRGMPVLTPPEACVSDGQLRPAFDSPNPDDLHHANAEYGALVWRRILQAAQAGVLPRFRTGAIGP